MFTKFLFFAVKTKYFTLRIIDYADMSHKYLVESENMEHACIYFSLPLWGDLLRMLSEKNM